MARAEGVHAQGGNRAARYRVGIGGDQGDFQFHRGFIHGFVRGNDVVVERGENHVGFAAQAACGGQYVGRTLCWRGDYLDVLFGGFGFQAFEHGGGIDFGGAVDVADGFQVGHQFFHQVDLRADGQFVGYAGDVGVRGFERGHEFGADGVGYGGVDEGDVFSGSGDCLRARGGDGDDGVGVGTGEFFRDLGGVGGAALRALEVYGEVFAFFKAFGFQAVQNACADGVERGVVGDGGDGDFFLFRRPRLPGGAVWPLSACLSAGVQAARMAAAMMPNMELVYAVRGVMVGFLSLKGLNYSGFCMFCNDGRRFACRLPDVSFQTASVPF